MFPILILLSLEVIFSFCLTKINILKKLIYGKPSFLVRKGKLDQSELARLRISIDEFLAELRQKDISDLSDVDYAILEDNGKLSVIQKGGNGFSHPLVVDGELVDDEIMQYGVTKERIQEILSSKGLSLSEVFLFTADDKGNTLLIKRSENKEKK